MATAATAGIPTQRPGFSPHRYQQIITPLGGILQARQATPQHAPSSTPSAQHTARQGTPSTQHAARGPAHAQHARPGTAHTARAHLAATSPASSDTAAPSTSSGTAHSPAPPSARATLQHPSTAHTRKLSTPLYENERFYRDFHRTKHPHVYGLDNSIKTSLRWITT